MQYKMKLHGRFSAFLRKYKNPLRGGPKNERGRLFGAP